MFRRGEMYTRWQIHDQVGGALQSFLPTVDGRVVAACLRLDTNPDAPAVILPGTGPGIEGAAARLVAQRDAVPTFLKRAVNCREYVGMYGVKRSTADPDVIAPHARRARRTDITSLIEMVAR